MTDLIDTDDAFRALIEHLAGVERYALDTEFHRERTYWADLALVQVAWPSQGNRPAGVALIDPLAVDFRPFERVLAEGGTLVAHAADQDLEVLYQACGARPRHLFDTQMAAAFLGHGLASLSTLAHSFLGKRLQKGDRLTDWSVRPLSPSQLLYAADDVAHLLDLADAIAKELSERGRLSWAEEECERLRCRPVGPSDPVRAWWKLRDARQLRGAARGVAQEVAAWRELRGRELNQPVRFALPDLALQAIVHGQPVTMPALRTIRGLDGRHLRGDVPSQILEAVVRGRNLPESALNLPPAEEVDRNWRPAVALAAAWVGQLARDERIDASLLATRADLVAFLSGDGASRLATGWRTDLVGRQLSRLIGGDAALAFGGGGRLVLEARSRTPLAPVEVETTPGLPGAGDHGQATDGADLDDAAGSEEPPLLDEAAVMGEAALLDEAAVVDGAPDLSRAAEVE